MIGRRKKASPLPSRVYEKNGAWYFVDIKRKWHKLCRVSDGITALYTALAEINRDTEARDDEMMTALVDAWLVAKLPGYAQNTQEEYRRMAMNIRKEFVEYRVDEVQPKTIARFLDLNLSKTPSLSNKYRALLSVIMAFGVRKGLRNDNPVREVSGLFRTAPDTASCWRASSTSRFQSDCDDWLMCGQSFGTVPDRNSAVASMQDAAAMPTGSTTRPRRILASGTTAAVPARNTKNAGNTM